MMSFTKQEKKEHRSWAFYAMAWIIGLIAFVLLVNAVIWTLSVAVSGPQGQGDAIREQNSAENWTSAQARFEEMYADIVATDRKIDVAADLAEQDPENQTYQQTLAGTKSYCLTVVGEYNAEARKFLSEDFRAADLPDQINNNDPDTDCKENL
jgi:hypothetical protein